MAVAVRNATSNAATSSSNSPSVNTPAGEASGDVVIAAIGTTKNAPSITGSPFTQLDTQTTVSPVTLAAVDEKLAGGSEPASYSWSLSAVSDWATVAAAISGADQTTPVNAHNSSISSGGSTSLVCPTVTTTVANCLIIEIVMQSTTSGNGPSFTAPSGTTLQAQAAATVSLSNNAGIAIISENALSGAPGTYGGDTITSTKTSPFAAFTIAIAPPQGTAFSRTASTSVTVSSAQTRSVSLPRAATTAVTVSSSVSRSVALVRVASASVSVSSAAARSAQAFSRSVAAAAAVSTSIFATSSTSIITVTLFESTNIDLDLRII